MKRKPALPSQIKSVLRLLACCCLCAPAAFAQQYSYDGNRWYEVEVMVFSNEGSASSTTERPQSEEAVLSYLLRLRFLRAASTSYQIPFAGDVADDKEGAKESTKENTRESARERRRNERAGNSASENTDSSNPNEAGPLLVSAVPNSYRIDDFDRDPFIALDKRFWGFNQDLLKLQNSGEHRVLWHALWRQPMQGSGQTSALAVIGGDRYGSHNQLEGSLRFSDNSGRVMMDLQLWLNNFYTGRPRGENAVKLPEQPGNQTGSVGAELTDSGNWNVADVWQLKDAKEVRSNEYYYLDNPAFGVLLQVRPYELPAKTTGTAEDDF